MRLTTGRKIAKVFAMKKKASKKASKKAKRALIVLSVLLLLAAALCAVYFFCFGRFVLVSDPAFSYLLPNSTLLRLRLALASAGKRLVVVNVTSTDLSSASSFTPILLSLSAKEILLSPVASECAVAYDLNVSSLLADSIVYGTWSQSCSLFDATIISDVNAGWTEVGHALVTMSQNVGVVYDSLGTSAYQAIENSFSGNGLIAYPYDGESGLYYSNTLSDMDEKQVVLAVCSHLETFYNFFSFDSSVSWIVDYRYAKMVPKKQLYGIVVPDLAGLGSKLVEQPAQKGSQTVYTLDYKYETR